MASRRTFAWTFAAFGALLLPSVARAQASDPAARPGAPPPKAPAAAADAAVDGNLLPTGDAPGPGAPTPGTPAAASVDPSQDQAGLLAQGKIRPTLSPLTDGASGLTPQAIYSEDWWAHTRPVIEVHGYFRTRGELYHNFSLGRHEDPTGDTQNLWRQPIDSSYGDRTGQRRSVRLCGDASSLGECINRTQATANLRLRLNPEIHISDNLRILTQVDLLDNLVLGSTPDSQAISPSGKTKSGWGPAGNGYNGYAPLSVFSTSQGAPTAGVNSYRNSIEVKRVWGEYLTPLGLLKFGRMPLHWGLGMLVNSGDRLDDDYQTNADRIMFVTGLKSQDIYFGGSWDFVSSGPTTQSPYDIYGGQAYNTGNLTNVDQWNLFVARRLNPDLQRAMLARGDVVVNGGLFALYRQQYLDIAQGENAISFDQEDVNRSNRGLLRRDAKAFIPDAWVQVRWKKLRVEAELAHIRGSIGTTPDSPNLNDPKQVRMWGLATQTEYRAVEDKLKLQFGFGWSSGDPWVEGLSPGASGLQPELNGRGPISTFRFHPSYMVDQIFFRKIMTRVQGAYYFRPSVDYDFVRNPNGQKFGGGAAIIWSRASEFVQSPGNKRDLGVELDLQLYYQAKDGSFNDDPSKIGGFYAMLQYGVFFPLGGLQYLPGEQTSISGVDNTFWDLATAQTVRLFLGVAF
jgi:uncharacterized protein (TIGR04551 family)